VSRPVTLFTGQWADLPLAELATKATDWGFDGLELASWGDYFDVAAAVADASFCRDHAALLERNGLGCRSDFPASPSSLDAAFAEESHGG
jgi:sugar phosphate isomerase/epimerase